MFHSHHKLNSITLTNIENSLITRENYLLKPLYVDMSTVVYFYLHKADHFIINCR